MDFVLKQPLCPVTAPLLRCHPEVRYFPRLLGPNEYLIFAQHDLRVEPDCTEYMFTGSDILLPVKNDLTALLHVFGPSGIVMLTKTNRLVEFCFMRVPNTTKSTLVFKRGQPFMRVCFSTRPILDALYPQEKPIWDYRAEAAEAEKAILEANSWDSLQYATAELVPFQRAVMNISAYLASFDEQESQSSANPAEKSSEDQRGSSSS